MDITKVNKIIDGFCRNDFSSIKDEVKNSPHTMNTDSALDSIESNDPYYVITALDSLAGIYYFTHDYDQSFVFAYATYFCVDSYLQATFTKRKEEAIYYAGSSAYYILASYLDTGDFKTGIELYKQICNKYPGNITENIFDSAKLKAIDLYLSANQPEEARKEFNKLVPDKIQNFNRTHYDDVAEKLRRLFTRVDVLPEESDSLKSAKMKESILGMLNSLEQAMEMGKPSPQEIQQLKDIRDLVQQLQDCQDDKRIEELCAKITEKNAAFFQILGAKDDSSVTSKRTTVSKMAEVIFSENPDIAELKSAVETLETLLRFFENKFPSDENFILWNIGTGYGLLDECQKAIDAFERLYENLEKIYSSISDKQERAGVFNRFPFLFNMLIRNYAVLKNTRGVLKTVEASKGRSLNDLMYEKSGRQRLPVNELNNKLVGVLQKEKVHYLSIFVDDEVALSILVTSNGKYHQLGTNRITKKVLQGWVQKNYQSPENWDNISTGLFGAKKKVDLSTDLSEIIKVLSFAMEEGDLKENDHIIYSQDGDLQLFPFQYVRFKDKYLIEWFSLSRIHNAFQLISLMDDEPLKKEKIVCYSIPAKQDEQNINKLNAFKEVYLWLQKNISMPFILPPATLQKMKTEITEKAIVHFAAHGVFPNGDFEEHEKNNPFYNSGLLMNENDLAPMLRADFEYYKTDNLLSPEKLLTLPDLFGKSHVTFQACVSGRSKEGVGGDAIGMEWAAFYCGADSLLSAAWDIDIFWVNKFCILFYEKWLNKGMSKAEAYTQAMRQILRSDLPSDKLNIYFWGGLILSGNWKL
ncbi:MAG: CHAT domain-containing protein [Bacteroidetes bacterium]|nr:CHAT domain-containing protein [Bacteroidota bacterium]